MSNSQGKNSVSLFLGDNLEPATYTLDIVRLIFHFFNFVNLTLGAINFGVGIGYEMTPISVSGGMHLIPVQTKFVVTGAFVLIHGIIGAYGFVSRQSRSLIVYGCLGFCLLIVGSIAAWTALTDEKKIILDSRNHFVEEWIEYNKRIDHSKEGKIPTTINSSTVLTSDDLFIWNLIWLEKSCHVQYIPQNIVYEETPEFNKEVDEFQEYPYYACKDSTSCTTDTNCDTQCNKNIETYDSTKCSSVCIVQELPYTCFKYVAILTKIRIVTIYVTLFLLSFTQSVCLLCDVLYLFWSLKEEADIECHQNLLMGKKKCSTKLQLLSKFLPCCFSLPQPTEYAKARNTLALSEICSVEEEEEEDSATETEPAETEPAETPPDRTPPDETQPAETPKEHNIAV